jgi:hypothetical protein
MKPLIIIITVLAALLGVFFWLDEDFDISLDQGSKPSPPAETKSQDRLLVCSLVSEPIVELGYTPDGKVNKQRQCNFLCQDKSEITVHTNTEYNCPQTLYD